MLSEAEIVAILGIDFESLCPGDKNGWHGAILTRSF